MFAHSLSRWLSQWAKSAPQLTQEKRTNHFRPRLNPLEDRTLPTAATIVDLGTLGGAFSSAQAINASGEVVGYAYTEDNHYFHAFRYADGTMTDLGTLPGANYSNAYGINDSREIVGDGFTPIVSYHAVSSDGDGLTDLGTMGGYYSEARGINASGQIVGWSENAMRYQHAVLIQDGVFTDLGTLGGQSSYGMAIDDAGSMVGYSETGTGIVHAFLDDGITMTDLGTLGGATSTATAIDAAGDVVGYSQIASGDRHAFLYSGGVMTDLGTLPGGAYSKALGINNSGLIVGEANVTADQQNPFAMMYDGTTMINLNDLLPQDSGWMLSTATAINDNGQIIGTGDHDGLSHAFLMTLDPSSIHQHTLALIANATLQPGAVFHALINPSMNGTFNTSPAAVASTHASTDVQPGQATPTGKPIALHTMGTPLPEAVTSWTTDDLIGAVLA
jgi:probable HAF family extracellular repeat protein